MEEEKKDKTFVVKDRRLFDESGRPRTEATPNSSAGPTAEKIKKAEPSPSTPTPTQVEEAPHPQEEQEAPEVNFYNFILSLSSTAMYHFGDFADPAARETKKNLAAAKQTIDLLTMLQEKTKGNLDRDENTLLEGILYELRMRYVKELTEG